MFMLENHTQYIIHKKIIHNRLFTMGTLNKLKEMKKIIPTERTGKSQK